ncbi:MAG: flagellar biosynthesis anti-sigma factor FlgM [Nitrospira sp.]|nr:flagellar biosynthesis anti-sigma factor FlgM [Nitrospira sp.]
MKIIGQNIVKNSDNQFTSGVKAVRTTSLSKGGVDGDSDDVKKTGYSNDRIEVSDRAKEFNSIKASVKGLPEIRDDKVKQLSEDVRRGMYKVDTDLIASGIVKESLLNNLIK